MAEQTEKQMEVKRLITKVSINDERVLIKYDVPGTTGVDSYTLECTDAPVPDFLESFTDLSKHMSKWLELADDWGDTVDMSEVIIKYDGQFFSAAFKIVKHLKYCLNPLKLMTPIKWNNESDDDSPHEKECIMHADVLMAINICLKDAQDYIKGIRKQGKLFSED